MRVAYLTTDEVNEVLALEMAQASGVALNPVAPKDAPPEEGYDAVLIDWDHWPGRRLEEFLVGLRGGQPSCRVAVHSYHLEDGPAEVLRTQGVAIHRCLQPEVFRSLQEATAQAGGTDPSADGRDRHDVVGHCGRPPARFTGIGS